MMWKQLSEELAAATAKTAERLLHVGGPGISGRTALVWGEGLAVTLARQAVDGEEVPVVLPGGQEAKATVHAWDPRTGLAVLKVAGLRPSSWELAPLPSVGSLVLSVAFPSPQGPEARLDLVRFASGANDWKPGVSLEALLQLDGAPFPGFTGAAVVDADGRLVGFIAENQAENAGFVVTAADLARLLDPLLKTGSPKRPWLGVSTRPGGGQGLVLVGIDDGSPAEKAGWRVGELLVSVAGRLLKEPSDLVQVLAALRPGETVSAQLLSEGQVQEKPVTPEGR